ncbi:unnamed protein product [Parajaminaea phylloscopi]
MDVAPKAEPVRWSLSIYARKHAVLPLLDSDPSLPHAIVFVPGLTDTFGTVPYLERLAHGLASYGFSVVQLQLSSSLGGYGVCSLEGDAQEMAQAVTWLRTQQKKDKIILMGHSTGCQDVMAYLSIDGGSAARGDDAIVDAAILQAPVSDREAWEHDVYGESSEDSSSSSESSGDTTSTGAQSSETKDKSKDIERLALATRLVKEGKGHQLLPREVKPVLKPDSNASKRQKGNVDAVWDPPMTAYRWWALCAKGGDDDYFSTDFGEAATKQIWRSAGQGLRAGGSGYLLALVGAEDEYIPRPKITPQSIVDVWNQSVQSMDASRCRFETLVDADHKANSEKAQIALVTKTREVIRALGVTAKQAAPAVVGLEGSKRPSRPPPPLLSKGIPAWQLADDVASADSTETAASAGGQTTAEASLSSRAPLQAQSAASATPPASTGAGVPPHPPSFDALVELIASGRTDEIEGIRDIPLQINESAPSESQMAVPKKPWEGDGAAQA